MAEEWPDAALQALDSMVATDTHMGVMRRRLTALLGFQPEASDVRLMANRYKPPGKTLAAPPMVIPEPTVVFPSEDSVFFAPRQRHPDKVRRVPRGTYPAPPGGFRMLSTRR